MPRIQIPITNVSETPVNYPVEIVADPANDHYLENNDGNVWLEVRNTDAAEREFSIQTGAVGAGALPVKNPVSKVPASSTTLVGPLIPQVYNETSGVDAGKVLIDVGFNFLRFRAFHLNPVPGTRRLGQVEGARVSIPITELFTEEHLAALLQPAYVTSDPANDHRLLWNDGRVILEINNLSASPQDAILNVNALAGEPRERVGGPVEIADNTITVPASGHVIAGGFNPAIYNTRAGVPSDAETLDINVTTDQLQFRAFHLAQVGTIR